MDNNFQSSPSSNNKKEVKQLGPGKKLPQWWVIAIIVVLIGALAYGVFGYWKPFQPSPQEILEKGFQKMANYKSYQSNLEGNIKLGLSEEQAENFPTNSIEASINAEIKEIPTDKKSEVSLSTEVKLANLPVTVAGVIRSIDKDIYVRADNLSLLEMFLPNTNLTGQWIKVPMDQLSSTSTKPSSIMAKAEEYKSQMMKTINQNPPFQVKKTLSSESIMETDCHHYLVGVNMDNMKKVVLEAINFITEETEATAPTAEGMQNFKDQWDKFAANNTDLTIEVWISKKGNNIRQITFGEKDKLASINLGEQNLNLFINQDFYKINEDLEIEAPSDYQTPQQLLQGTSDFSNMKEGLLQF